MKKFFSVTAIIGVMMAVAIGASAAPEKGQQTRQAPSDKADQAVVGTPQTISGQNDIRLITPNMNSRERMEVQRAIQKRAAAKRNQLLLEAANENGQ
jgi:hypothetical protein